MTAAAQAISLSTHEVLDRASTKGPDLQDLSDRFNRLMAHDPDPAFYAQSHGHEAATPVTHFVRQQEEVMRQTFNEVRAFGREAPTMDVQTMAARQIELNYQLAMVQVQFNSGVYVAQSSKNGLQTLMKNQ